VVGWSYDAGGNLTSDGTTSYSYDALSHLTGASATGQNNNYVYNGDGMLVSQTTNGTTTSYAQDLAASQSQILAATTGITSTNYLYGSDIAPLLALSGSSRTWYGVDGQGSVRQTLDDAANVLGIQSYDPYGQIESGSSLTSIFGYRGELQAPLTNAEYVQARWYQPGTAQLLGVDPALASTDQPYAYAYDNPVRWSDPTGQFPDLNPCDLPGIHQGCEVVGGAAGAVGATVVTGLRTGLRDAVIALNNTLTASAQGGFIAGVAQADLDFAEQTTKLPQSVITHLNLLKFYAENPALGWPVIEKLLLPAYEQQIAQLSPTALITNGVTAVSTLAGLVKQVALGATCHTVGYDIGYGLTSFILNFAVAWATKGAGEGIASALRGAEIDAAAADLPVAMAKGDTQAAAEDQQALNNLGCSFPGNTGVATLHGLVSIAAVHVGDMVMAEDPATGKVETERVQAVIAEAIKPLMQIQMSDGSSLSVTTNHPFYVNSGPGITTPQWVAAGDLRVGDHLRTEDGRDVAVTELRYHTGYAHVYTLTVANDHDFFVGTGGENVLVHNSLFDGTCPVGRPVNSDWNISSLRTRGKVIEGRYIPPGNVITIPTYPVIDVFIPATGEAE
jgi:RHS repeat-associated protein